MVSSCDMKRTEPIIGKKINANLLLFATSLFREYVGDGDFSLLICLIKKNFYGKTDKEDIRLFECPIPDCYMYSRDKFKPGPARGYMCNLYSYVGTSLQDDLINELSEYADSKCLYNAIVQAISELESYYIRYEEKSIVDNAFVFNSRTREVVPLTDLKFKSGIDIFVKNKSL